MIDYALEQQIEHVKELHTQWSAFRDYYKIGEAKEKPSKEQEEAFLECKKRIAMLHDEFMETLPNTESQSSRKKQNDGKSIIKHVIHCVTIKHIHTFYNNQHKEFEKHWNDAYLLLTETIELLEKKRDALAGVSYTSLAMQEWKEKVATTVKNIVKGPLVKIALPLSVILVLPFVVHMLGFYDLQRIPMDIPSVTKVYYPAERAFRRLVTPSLKYTSLAYTDRVESNLPSNYTYLNSQTSTDLARGRSAVIISQFGPPLDLSQAISTAIDFKLEGYTVPESQPLDMYMFLMPSNTAARDDIMRVYLEWRDNLQVPMRNQFDQNYSFFSRNNAIIFIISPSVEARDYFKLRQWGVR